MPFYRLVIFIPSGLLIAWIAAPAFAQTADANAAIYAAVAPTDDAVAMALKRSNPVAALTRLTTPSVSLASVEYSDPQTASLSPPTAAPERVNDGTDPTRLTTLAGIDIEHLDLRNGFNSETLTLGLNIPLGEAKRSSIRMEVPFAAVDALGNESMGLSDVSVKLTRVLEVNRKYGIVVSGKVAFDTADRLELGNGKMVVEGAFVYANFLKGGHIFAPALVHKISVAGSDRRADVSLTTIDLYYVPRLKNPKMFMTIDPALNHDWVNDATFGALAVTFGRSVGKVFGGIGQVTLRPSILVGGNRPANWGIKVGFRVVNF